ncbi:MAG: isoprenylcysteine carboxylmethyltransferase family protein [Variovorax sp.]
MIVPTIPQAILLFLLGGVFLHFLMAGGRTFHVVNADLEPAAWISQIMFVFGGTVAAWYLGLHQPMHPLNGVIAALLLAISLSLYEWARHTIIRRRFGIAGSGHVPEALCDAGPYRFIRHPIYLGYMLAHLAVLAAIPHWVTAAIFAAVAAICAYWAIDDERALMASGLAADYASYRQRTGMFLPKLSRAAPGRQPR